MAKNSSEHSRFLHLLSTFGGPDASRYDNPKDEFGVIKTKEIQICSRCKNKIEDNDCPYCQERGYLTAEAKTVLESTLDENLFGEKFGNALVREGLVERTDSVEAIENGLCISLILPSKLRVSLILFKLGSIGEETFRQTTAIMNKEKSCEYLVCLCKKYEDGISKILNFYPKVRISTYEEAARSETLLKDYVTAFQVLEKLDSKKHTALFSENEDISLAIKRSKEIVAKIKEDGKSSKALGNELENELKKVLGYLFTAMEISDRDRLPEVVIFDCKSGFYLVDIKSGQYNISEYRKVQSYATNYYELSTENNDILKIKGVVVPNILWRDKSKDIASAFSEFVRNYTPFQNLNVGITLIDVEAILELAEKKPSMTKNCHTHLLLNLESIFKQGSISVNEINKTVDEMQKKTESSEDAISKSLSDSRSRFSP